jgi:hypothetical protein
MDGKRRTVMSMTTLASATEFTRSESHAAYARHEPDGGDPNRPAMRDRVPAQSDSEGGAGEFEGTAANLKCFPQNFAV